MENNTEEQREKIKSYLKLKEEREIGYWSDYNGNRGCWTL